jgi:hypothetical protein
MAGHISSSGHLFFLSKAGDHPIVPQEPVKSSIVLEISCEKGFFPACALASADAGTKADLVEGVNPAVCGLASCSLPLPNPVGNRPSGAVRERMCFEKESAAGNGQEKGYPRHMAGMHQAAIRESASGGEAG